MKSAGTVKSRCGESRSNDNTQGFLNITSPQLSYRDSTDHSPLPHPPSPSLDSHHPEVCLQLDRVGRRVGAVEGPVEHVEGDHVARAGVPQGAQAGQPEIATLPSSTVYVTISRSPSGSPVPLQQPHCGHGRGRRRRHLRPVAPLVRGAPQALHELHLGLHYCRVVHTCLLAVLSAGRRCVDDSPHHCTPLLLPTPRTQKINNKKEEETFTVPPPYTTQQPAGSLQLLLLPLILRIPVF